MNSATFQSTGVTLLPFIGSPFSPVNDALLDWIKDEIGYIHEEAGNDDCNDAVDPQQTVGSQH